MQTVEQAIGIVKMMENKTKQSTPARIVAGMNKSFHQRQREAEDADPLNSAHQLAVLKSKKSTTDFFNALHNPTHPKHDQAIKDWKEKYKCDSGVVEKAHLQVAMDEGAAYPFEKADTAYEERVLRKFKPLASATTQHTMAMHQAFATAWKQKIFARGYRGDKTFLATLAEKYSLRKI